MSSVAENADRIAEVTSGTSWASLGSSVALIRSDRSQLSRRRFQLRFSAAKTSPVRRKTLHGAASYSLGENE